MLEREFECRPAIQTSNDENTDEKILSIVRFAHEELEGNSTQDTSVVSSDGLLFKCSICQRDVSSQRSRGKSRPMNFHQQTAFCKDHQVEDAKIEWAQCGYPRIAWRRLHLRLKKKSLALRDIINGSSSFFGTELQAAIDRKEARKYRCMENMTAGYYGPRGQQVM